MLLLFLIQSYNMSPEHQIGLRVCLSDYTLSAVFHPSQLCNSPCPCYAGPSEVETGTNSRSWGWLWWWRCCCFVVEMTYYNHKIHMRCYDEDHLNQRCLRSLNGCVVQWLTYISRLMLMLTTRLRTFFLGKRGETDDILLLRRLNIQ